MVCSFHLLENIFNLIFNPVPFRERCKMVLSETAASSFSKLVFQNLSHLFNQYIALGETVFRIKEFHTGKIKKYHRTFNSFFMHTLTVFLRNLEKGFHIQKTRQIIQVCFLEACTLCLILYRTLQIGKAAPVRNCFTEIRFIETPFILIHPFIRDTECHPYIAAFIFNTTSDGKGKALIFFTVFFYLFQPVKQFLFLNIKLYYGKFISACTENFGFIKSLSEYFRCVFQHNVSRRMAL